MCQSNRSPRLGLLSFPFLLPFLHWYPFFTRQVLFKSTPHRLSCWINPPLSDYMDSSSCFGGTETIRFCKLSCPCWSYDQDDKVRNMHRHNANVCVWKEGPHVYQCTRRWLLIQRGIPRGSRDPRVPYLGGVVVCRIHHPWILLHIMGNPPALH